MTYFLLKVDGPSVELTNKIMNSTENGVATWSYLNLAISLTKHIFVIIVKRKMTIDCRV